jgi:flagellin-like protein
MRGVTGLLALLIMIAGTVALASWANQFFGTVGLIVAGVLGLLVIASTLRL